jgi:hypothetical protein
LAGDLSEKTPKHHTKAVKLAQKENWLPMADRLILCNVFEKDIKAVDAYTALNGDDIEFRQMWIQEKVEEVKALIFYISFRSHVYLKPLCSSFDHVLSFTL